MSNHGAKIDYKTEGFSDFSKLSDFSAFPCPPHSQNHVKSWNIQCNLRVDSAYNMAINMFTVCVKRPTRPHMNGDSIDQCLLIRKRVAGVYQAVTRAEGGLHRKDKHRQQTSFSS